MIERDLTQKTETSLLGLGLSLSTLDRSLTSGVKSFRTSIHTTLLTLCVSFAKHPFIHLSNENHDIYS